MLHANIGRLFLQTPAPVQYGFAFIFIIYAILYQICHVFLTLIFENPAVLFFFYQYLTKKLESLWCELFWKVA